ncbi:MAG TPA: nucleotidyl transferase AbiEii/AbiGii toxin family protein [bacterium]|jgi:predicted nucleotidyltransferase component of viral defense system
MTVTSPLQKREIFHLVFLRILIQKFPVSKIALKGGSNLRFFFGSIRYSEDMDLDIAPTEAVHRVQERVLGVLDSTVFVDTLRMYGIDRIQPPDMSRAKQTKTVQRFKVHLISNAGEDLFTKVELSRRGLDSPILNEPISTSVLYPYRLPPFIAPHYPAVVAARQKIQALLSRKESQARDVFDLYVLSSQIEESDTSLTAGLSTIDLKRVSETIHQMRFDEYSDTVVSYLGPDDQQAYGSRSGWESIQLRVLELLDVGPDLNG